MFSPAGSNPPPASIRTSRRRQRPLSNEGSIPKAKRQRSALSDQTFVPPDGPPEMQEAKAYKPAAIVPQESIREVSLHHKEIAVRGKKQRLGDRNSKGDGSVVLTTNDTYTVSKLPALPDRLRANAKERQHGAIYSDSGYALSLTHTHAIVWPYAINVASPETFTFAIPHPSKHLSDPLPLGSLVSASASSSEPGLVVVPTTGKITYWESIASAATLDLRLQRNGVDLSISGMLSGETVIQILNAESAGFMLAFSTGRIAYMSVRDGQGRPAISVQFLRSGAGSANTGIFGSLRNALSSSSSRGDIAAVRAGRPEKVGERNVVLATAKGKLQSWDIHRGGHTSLIAEAEAREAIVLAIKEATPAMSELLIETFEILDFTHATNSFTDNGEEDANLLLLTSLGDRQISHYILVEILLKRSELIVKNIRPIKSYTTPVNRAATSNTRLYFPAPSLVAYAVFDRAVVVVSMAKQPDTPEMQLRLESHLLPQTFEDVIDFRKDMNVEIVGSGMEEVNGSSYGIEDSKSSRRHKAKHPATVLIVRGGGVLRIAATDVTKLTSNQAQQVTARSKLEQAVFFGNVEHNPINFAVRSELEFPAEEVGEAALELSRDILKSQTPYIPSAPGSIDQNLRKRSAALLDLADYLRTSRVALDRVTRWRLLWDAERMEAATIIWRRYDATVRQKPVGQKRGLLTEVIEYIHEDYKTEPLPEAGELDRVRHWFINDIWNLEIALPWAFQVIKYTYQDGQKDHSFVMEITSEANDLLVGALQGAFDFRTANIGLYGLQAEQLEHGILKKNYEGLPPFWTSTFFGVENIRKQLELAGALVTEYSETSPREGQPSAELVGKVKDELHVLADMSIRSNKERIRWCSVQDDPQFQIEAEELTGQQEVAADAAIKLLAKELNSPGEAIVLAEKHEILPTLAFVLMFELNECSRKAINNSTGSLNVSALDINNEQSRALQATVRQCFSKFGTRWANALYELDVELDSMRVLLDGFPEELAYLTAFLRSKPEYAKIAWIHEITRTHDFDQAAQTLLDLSLIREQNLWSKKIELSIGKLARLVGKNYSQKDGIIIPDGGKSELITMHNQLGLIKIQETAYDFILPSISAAIDENAEVQLALEVHGSKLSSKQPAFNSLLGENMTRLIKHTAMNASALVDLLTLMDDNDPEEQSIFRGERFYLAIEATRYGLADRKDQVLCQRVIWRRCMLRDNWTDINNTDMKDDFQISEQLRRTALYLAFRGCLKNHLFDKASTIKPIKPRDILGACTDELDHRFSGLDASIRERITKDFEVEDDNFNVLLERYRLEKWYSEALDLARQDFTEEVADETEDGKKMRQVKMALEEAEKAISEKEKSAAERLLHSKLTFKPKAKLNGGFSNSVKKY